MNSASMYARRPVRVTGTAGFSGSQLCERLLEPSHGVLALDNLSSGDERNLAPLQAHPRLHFVAARPPRRDHAHRARQPAALAAPHARTATPPGAWQ